MAKVVVKSKVKKIKRKFPVEIKAPEVFNNISLGKTSTTDLKLFIGKTVKMNLMYITKSVKNQNVRMLFKVIDVDSGVAKTEVKSYEQIAYYLKRFIKAGSDLVEDSFVCKSKDGKNVRVKSFVVTKKSTSSMILSDLRSKIEELVSSDVSKFTAEEYIHNVAMGKVQLGYRNELKKISPLKAFEFRKVVVEE